MHRNYLCALSIVAMALGGSVFAQEEPRSSFEKTSQLEPKPTTSIAGSVVSMSGHTLAIDTGAGNRMTFELASSDVIPLGTAIGTRVLVTYGPRATGINRVTQVKVTTEPTAAPGEGPSK